MGNNSDVEIMAHEQTYDGFVKLLKYGAVICFIVAFVVILVIAH